MKTYLLFKNGKLVTVVQTKTNNVTLVEIKHMLIDYDYIAEDPENAERQIVEWRARE